jgi:hypothetical protein
LQRMQISGSIRCCLMTSAWVASITRSPLGRHCER